MKRSLLHLCLRFGVLSGVLLGPVLRLEAKSDFTASEITVASQTVLEGEVAHFKLWLRNRGDEAADPTQVRIQWPLMNTIPMKPRALHGVLMAIHSCA